MRGAMAIAAIIPTAPAVAQTFACVMSDGQDVSFRVDPSQFTDAVSAEEPIRKWATRVKWGSQKLLAEPFAIGDMYGFSAEGVGGGTLMFVIDSNGDAVLTNRRSGYRHTGECEVNQ